MICQTRRPYSSLYYLQMTVLKFILFAVDSTQVYTICRWQYSGVLLTVVSAWLDWTSSSDFWRLGWRDFFVPTVLLSTFIHFFLTSSPLFLIVLFQSFCSASSHAQVFGRTLVHEFLFSYSHSEWNLLFLKQTPLWHEAAQFGRRTHIWRIYLFVLYLRKKLYI